MATATTTPFLTQPVCAGIYADNVTTLNPQITILAPDGQVVASDWYVKSQAIGGLASGLSQDIYTFQRSQYAQTASGSSLDLQASNMAITPRYSNFYAYGQGHINTAPVSTVTIPFNTELVDPISGNTYLTTQTTVVTALAPLIPIIFRANTIGPGFSLAAGVQLTLSTPIVGIDFINVNFITDGFFAESDSSLASRIISAWQNPPGGGSVADFERWALFYQAFVTGSFVFRFQVTTSISTVVIVYVSVMQGTFQPDVILLTPLIPYSRTATADVVDMTYLYIESVRPANVVEVTNTVSTFMIPSIINVQVVLIPGYDLTTFISSVGLTVEDLVKREVRRSIISTPTGGTIQFNPTVMQNQNFILISDIEQTLDLGLAATYTEVGTYASILMNRRVSYPDPTGQIPIPFGNAILDISGNSQVIYDISYTNILVVMETI